VYLRTLYAHAAPGRARTLLTLHNVRYQGRFPADKFAVTGLGREQFTVNGLEFYGDINLLKGGLIHATLLSAVSKQYAKEIQTPEYGEELDGVLRTRAADLHGILNGADYSVWDPAVDPQIPAPYGPDDLGGKAVCKRALQQECGLPVRDVPLLGLISRLDDQKGLDLVRDLLDDLMAMDLQLVLLGEGHPDYHQLVTEWSLQYPTKFSGHLRLDEPLSHHIEAGADIFLMPSRYEPCGLNQLYSLRYGTVPVVRKTGGLADTITNCTPSSLGKGTANGFSFQSYSARALFATLLRALKLHGDRRHWRRLMVTGMRQDWSWDRSAREYLALYQKALAR
jgi:starch synthase